MKKYVVILACGSGTRMQSDIPKQYILLNNKPIVFHTIETISGFDSSYNIIVVINKEHNGLFSEFSKRYALNLPFKLVFGGEERFFSVKNALSTIKEEDSLVAIHDGVRPIVEKRMFEESFAAASQYGNAICCVKATDSIRKGDENTNCAIDRREIFLVQTPQTFKTSVIKKAYSQEYKPIFTDDASVAESIGEKIHIIQGNKANIKITFPIDLSIAAQLLTKVPNQ